VDPSSRYGNERTRRLTRTTDRCSANCYNNPAGSSLCQSDSHCSQLLGAVGAGVWIEPPFFCDCGEHIRLGARVYMNFQCVILDCNPVTLGDDVFLGPGVHIYAATHPLDPDERIKGPELGHPVTIGAKVWIGGGSIICPGVTIGEDSTIGAGSVVVRDIPPYVFAAGNPCRVIRTLR
jgi:maltose O-acetyltransferase